MRPARRIGALGIAALAGIVFGTNAARADSVSQGVAWLVTHQDPSGFWTTAGDPPYLATGAALVVLAAQAADSQAVGLGIRALESAPLSSTDFLARCAMSLASCRRGLISERIMEELRQRQGGDGGWGAYAEYGSNVLDTGLSLVAGARFRDPPDLAAAAAILSSVQNADGGWGFSSGQPSRVLYAATAIRALTAVRGELDVETDLQQGLTWLKAQARPDGGFGSGGISNPRETGLVLAALAKVDPSAPQIANARQYLRTTQLSDGSWGSDSHSTAMALYGLIQSLPDLAVASADISFSDSAPSDSETVTIFATIHNVGAGPASQVRTRVYLRHPDQGGVQIGADQILPSLPAGGQGLVQVTWNTYGHSGDQEFFVLVDPLDAIQEGDAGNNVASAALRVVLRPDLLISAMSCEPEDPDSTDQIFINVSVRNAGESTAQNISLQIWDGDPDSSGTALLQPAGVIPAIGPGDVFTARVNMGGYFSTSGDHHIWACADPALEIREQNEDNNCAQMPLRVGVVCGEPILYPGLDLLGLPADPRPAVTSFSLLGLLPRCYEVNGWNRSGQVWQSAAALSQGAVIGEDFGLGPRDGFFIRTDDANVAEMCGRATTIPGCTDLSPGLNLISVPDEGACYTGYSLIGSINTCTEAHSWDPATQSWVTAIKVGPGEYLGEDFTVRPGHGFFVKVQSGGQWCTAACDTIVSLPDLAVTQADIYISSNPAQVGQPVFIGVNVKNLGSVTAISPRADIYIGNPDAGGQDVLPMSLPDIPPGQESGCWGAWFNFSGPGTGQIWGVADINNEIVEISETNNRAYRVLQVTPAALAGMDSGSGLTPGMASAPQLFLVTPAQPVETGTIAASDDARPATKPASAAEASTIAHVSAGSHSSSSVTITWVTDVATDGCVHFGATPNLGSTACEQDELRRVHHVVLNGLEAETTYDFKVVSGGLADDNGGNLYSFTTTKAGVGIPSVLYGGVIAQAGGPGVPGIAVTAQVLREQGPSHPLVCLTDSRGQWILNLGNLKDPASGDVFAYAPGDRVVLGFLEPQGSPQADTVTVSGESPQGCGTRPLQVPSDLTEPPLNLPVSYYLERNYPNPFSRSTSIAFGLPVASRVEISVYNVAGQRIAALAEGEYPAGHHVVAWDGRNSQGESVSSGIYFYQLRANGFDQVRRMFILK
jgi:hypothetical protein